MKICEHLRPRGNQFRKTRQNESERAEFKTLAIINNIISFINLHSVNKKFQLLKWEGMIDLFVFFSLYKKQRMTNELLAEQLVMHETMRALRIMFHARSISKSQTF